MGKHVFQREQQICLQNSKTLTKFELKSNVTKRIDGIFVCKSIQRKN